MRLKTPTAPLRSLALTVEEPTPGAYRWRLLEAQPLSQTFVSLACLEPSFSAYDVALASGYGELQRVAGSDLQFGPRAEPAAIAAPVAHGGASRASGDGLLLTRVVPA